FIRLVGPAAAWTTLEWVFGLPAVDIPCTVGVLAVGSPALALLSVGGVHLLSFFLLLSSAAIAACAPAFPIRPPAPPLARARLLLPSLAPMIVALVAGVALRTMSAEPYRTLRYQAIQPAIPFDVANESWMVPTHRAEIRERFAEEVRRARESDAELVLWP